jgi:hypothetical protein
MSIFFGALVLSLLLLPGFIFRMGYLAKPFASRSFSSSFIEELLFSLLPAFFLQVCGYLIVKSFATVDERTFLLLLVNSDKAAAGNSISGDSIWRFAVYFFALSGCALGLGFIMRAIALRTRLHLRYSLFRIYNEWQIYFDGWILDYPDEAGDRKNVRIKWLDVLVENADGAFIYSGFLEQYVIGKDESLDRVYLRAVRRRRMKDDAMPQNADIPDASESREENYDISTDGDAALNERFDKRYYFMPGDFFMIPGTEIKSINITYYAEKVLTP